MSQIKTCKICTLEIEGAKEICSSTIHQKYEIGREIIQEDSHSGDLFFLCSGDVIIQKQPQNEVGLLEIARIGEGGILGEMELLTNKRTVASVVAGKNCSLHRIPKEKFNEFFQGGNSAAIYLFSLIARTLAHRLAKMDEKVVEILSSKGRKTEPFQEFAEFREKLLKNWDF